MALVLKDRVLETSQTSGTGTLTLAGAVPSFQSFSSAIGNGNTTYYTISDDADNQWEVGVGTVGAGTLTRDTVLSSSNGGAKVNFGTSIKNVFCDYPASKTITLDANGNPIFGGNSYQDYASISVPSYLEGRTWYDSNSHALAYYNDSANSIVHIGQDLQLKVINNTGSTIANGSPVYITGTSSGQTYPNIALAKADVAATSAVIGLTNGAIANGAIGYVTAQGGIDGVNTGTFTVGQVLYLSPYSAGQLMNTIPPTGITVQVGVVSYVNSSTGKIYVKQTTPLAVPASIITGTLGVANGGTGVQTITGYVKGSGTSAFTGSSTIPNTDISGLGTMSTQNANSVAITGGSIDGTTIGATTASSVKATSLSAPLSNLASSNTSTFQLGSNLSFSDTGITNNIVGSTNSYLQSALQNTNSGSSASAEYIVYNDQGTAATNFATVGINSSTYSGTGSINAAGYGYFLTGSTDLVLGTIGNNKIHFATNSQATDAVTIGTDNSLTVNGTITGQTEVLKGTGTNLLLQSQSIGTSPWSTLNGGTLTTNTTVAPDSTTTASTLTATTGTAHTTARQYPSVVTYPATYTTSIYAKKGTSNYLYIANVFMINGGGNAADIAWFNLNTGALGTVQSGVTATITSVGNGWYRCTASGISNTTNSYGIVDFGISDADNSQNVTTGNAIYLWGAQFEFGSTVGSYTLTTSAAVYNAPTLSFSNNAQIGMQSDGSLYVSPAGTGALQAQATTSSTVGGNARGANAVDWQTSRNAASQVASSSFTSIGGGYQNTASAFNSSIAGGSSNLVQGNYNFIGGGNGNTANGNFGTTSSSIVGGSTNTANGFYNFIGGGFTNSGTSNAAVTTQSGTMNGTTAVTLSGSNANIKVGQYITGTSINVDTYVAAISGTSLTLSRNASGSSTSTLSFYTPHGVVVGGGNNQATGSYSFIGGGGDAGTAANRNVASGAWSTVAGGWKNNATGESSFIGGGGSYGGGVSGNLSSGTSSFVGAGYANTAGGYASTTVGGASNLTINNYSFVGGGSNNSSNANYSAIMGGIYGTARSIEGNQVFPACSSPIASSAGVSQAALLILGVQTTDATATVLRSNTSAASTTNQVILPNNSAYYFRGEIVSGVTGGGNTKGWYIEGVIKRGANAASTALVGTPTVTSLYADAGATTWSIAVTADTTNGGLAVTFTGQAATTIRTVAQIRTTEMTY